MRLAFFLMFLLLIQGCVQGIQQSSPEHTQAKADTIPIMVQTRPLATGFEIEECLKPEGKKLLEDWLSEPQL
jgi:hypothetical protein